MRLTPRSSGLVAGLVLIGCVHSASPDGEGRIVGRRDGPKLTHPTQLTLRRTGCLGTCPIYMVTLRSDGSARYKGEQWVAMVGTYCGLTAPAFFSQVVQELIRDGFNTWRESYAAAGTDHAGVSITLSGDGVRKTVSQLGAPDDLPTAFHAITTKIDSLTSAMAWQRCDSSGAQ